MVFTHLRCPDDRGRTASAAPVVANRSQEVPVTTTQEKTAARTTAEGWLTAFADALSARDIDRAVALFADESYWRDLVAFTWNLKTVEHHDGVRDLLENTLDGTDPSHWEISAEPTEAGGVTDVWFTFETAVGRGSGHAPCGTGPAARGGGVGLGLA